MSNLRPKTVTGENNRKFGPTEEHKAEDNQSLLPTRKLKMTPISQVETVKHL